MLLHGGAQANPGLYLTDGKTTRQAPLYAAARRGHDECVKVLLGAGADVHRVNNELGAPLYAGVCAASPSTSARSTASRPRRSNALTSASTALASARWRTRG